MKKIVIVVIALSFSIALSAQPTLSHGIAFGATLSKDFELTNDFGDVPKESIFQSIRFGYAAELTAPLSREVYLGGTVMGTIGANFRALPKVGDDEFDSDGNLIEKESGLDGFFTNLIEANFKIAPLVGYKLQPYRRPQYYTFALAPITVATDFGLSAGDKKSSSIYLGTGFEFGYYWTQGDQTDYSGVIFALDYKWNQKENIGSGFQNKDGYWGLDITISSRKAFNF